MEKVSLGYDRIRVLVLAVVHRGRVVTRQFVRQTLLGLADKSASYTIKSELITRALEDLSDEILIETFAGSEGRQRPFGLTRAARDELAHSLREHQAVTEILRAIHDTVGPQAA